MRDRQAYQPSGSIGDFATGRGRAVAKLCPMCGAGLMDRRKTYCAPCYDKRLETNIAANRHKYSKK